MLRSRGIIYTMEVQNYVHGEANKPLPSCRGVEQVVQCRWDSSVLASTLRNQVHMVLLPEMKVTELN
jgi:hypothetical protein